FGTEVVRELAKRLLPEQVSLEDFGIRAYDLAYALTDSYQAIILVDAMPRSRPPGTICLVEPDVSRALSSDTSARSGTRDTLKSARKTRGEQELTAVDAHAMNLDAVLKMAQTLGGVRGKLLLVACEPAVLECEGGEIGLSPAVRAAVPTAVAL